MTIHSNKSKVVFVVTKYNGSHLIEAENDDIFSRLSYDTLENNCVENLPPISGIYNGILSYLIIDKNTVESRIESYSEVKC